MENVRHRARPETSDNILEVEEKILSTFSRWRIVMRPFSRGAHLNGNINVTQHIPMGEPAPLCRGIEESYSRIHVSGKPVYVIMSVGFG